MFGVSGCFIRKEVRVKINQDFAMSVAMVQFLKKRKNSDYLQASEIAAALDFSVGYLQKVIQMLSKQGIVECKRGRIGGVRLKAKVITLLDLWQATCGGLNYRNPSLPLMKEPLKAFSDSMGNVAVYAKG